ncbi:MAG TPA: hypothetical protein VGJ84_06830 [Polyangiaceae bacterium]
MNFLSAISAFNASSSLDHAAGLFGMADFFWDSMIFQSGRWTDAMNKVRIGLPLIAALAVIWTWRSRKLGAPVPERIQRRFGVLFTAVAFFAYFDFFNPNTRYPEYYHRHELFHYYLGSKYFAEIGYTRLYECASIAEVELGRGQSVRDREIRDLRVNLIKPMADTYVLSRPEECKSHFTPQRWEQWKKDVDWIHKSAAGEYYENMVKDHGYNPPPVWTMDGKFFGSLGVAGDKFFKALASIDVLFHIGIVLLIGWAFGWKVMMVATVFWGCNAPANFYWTGGAFMRQDWIFFLVASLCLAKKRMFALSGAALTWSALLRVFPVILFAGPGIVILLQLIQKYRRVQAGGGGGLLRESKPKNLLEWLHPTHRRFIGGCVIATGILVPASVVVAGPDAYVDFAKHINVHKHTPLTNHMGLETVLVHDWKGRMRFTRDDNMDDPFEGWKQGRLDRFHTMKPVFYGITLGIFLWTVWALRRTKALWLAMPLGLGLVFCLTNLTCYYYSMYIIAAALVMARPELAPVILLTSSASQILQIDYYWVDDKFTVQAWLFFLFSVLLLIAYSRPFSMERLRAWWNDQPEPRLKHAPSSSASAAAE